MTRKLFLITFFLTFFHPVQAQLEYALNPEKREILERDFERLCELDFDAEFEFGNKEKWESVLKRAFGLEKIDCLEFRKFIEARVGLVVDHIQSDNIVIIDSDGTVKRKEDWNFLLARFVERAMQKTHSFLANANGARLEGFLYSTFDDLINEWSWFPLKIIGIQNYSFFLEYTTDDGDKKFFPIVGGAVLGVVFLTNSFFNQPFGSFYRMGIFIHEARHESMEFMHVPCLNSRGFCENAPDGPFGLEALFFAYIAGICDDNCSKPEKDFFVVAALRFFGYINTYQSDDHKIHPLLEGELKDKQLALDIYDVMTSL